MSGAVLAVINGRAGGTSDDDRDGLRTLITASFPDAEVVFTDAGTDVAALAKGAVARGARLVIAGGGDGTVSAVASALQGTDAVLGLLPLGTLNHFAKDLRIPAGTADAVRVLAEGNEMPVDVGVVNERVFLNNSGLGLYPGMVTLREKRQREGWKKWPALAWAMLKVLARYRRFTVRVESDGRAMVRTTPVVFVGNNDYFTQGVRVGTRDHLDGGKLSLFIPSHRHALTLLWYSIRAILGFQDRPGEMDHLLAGEVIIESGHREMSVSLDGEVERMRTPLHYRILPAALRVLVPAPAGA